MNDNLTLFKSQCEKFGGIVLNELVGKTKITRIQNEGVVNNPIIDELYTTEWTYSIDFEIDNSKCRACIYMFGNEKTITIHYYIYNNNERIFFEESTGSDIDLEIIKELKHTINLIINPHKEYLVVYWENSYLQIKRYKNSFEAGDEVDRIMISISGANTKEFEDDFHGIDYESMYKHNDVEMFDWGLRYEYSSCGDFVVKNSKYAIIKCNEESMDCEGANDISDAIEKMNQSIKQYKEKNPKCELEIYDQMGVKESCDNAIWQIIKL